MPALSPELTLLYIGYFNRFPDPLGGGFWQGVYDLGFPLDEIAEDFSTQPESIALYSYFDAPSMGTPEQFLRDVYDNLFNRKPDGPGLEFWGDYIKAGGRVGDVILSIIEGAVPADRAVLDSKLEAAELWCERVDEDPDFVYDAAAQAASQNALNQAGTDPDDQAEALSDIELFFDDAPSLTVSSVVSALSEAADTTSRIKVADFEVLDKSEGGANVVSLTGPHAELFEIDGTEVFLKAGTGLDFETGSRLLVALAVDDDQVGDSPDDTDSFIIAIVDVDEETTLDGPDGPDTGTPTPGPYVPPSFSLINVLETLPETALTFDRIKVADIRISVGSTTRLELLLSGPDATLFEVDNLELFLRAGTVLDFETNPSLDLVIEIDDLGESGFPNNMVPLQIDVTDANDPPMVALINTVTTIVENTDTAAPIKVADIVVTDDASGTETLGLAGDDAGLFSIVGNELFIAANAVLDFEATPVLDVSVTIDDVTTGGTPDDSAPLQIMLTDVTDQVELSAVELDSDARGFVINGVTNNDRAGTSTAVSGDVNGDGLDDLIVGARGVDTNGSGSGAGYVVFGKSDGTAVELSAVEGGTGGFVINGVAIGDAAGISVSSAGDVNGDGLDDLIIGTADADPNGNSSGASYVVFGKSDGATVELSALDDNLNNTGFVINGTAADDESGRSVRAAGDVDGDGLADLIVGAKDEDTTANRAGASYVVFGKTDGGVVELSDLDNDADDSGFAMFGVSSGDGSGRSVSGAGDVNGDGLDDLIVGAYNDTQNGNFSGSAFVVFGKSGGTSIDLSSVEAGNGGFIMNGVAAFNSAGWSVSGGGDVNGDGLTDLIVGAYAADPNGPDTGATYVVFGKTDTGVIELSDVEGGTGGFGIYGATVDDDSGRRVHNAGDVNGDGLDDILVAARTADPNGGDSGAAYLIYGKTDGTLVELSDIEQGDPGGFVINGVTTDDRLGKSVGAAGDVNGDGFDDLIVGADQDDPNGGQSGASFVVFGGDFTGSATEVGGTGDDTLTGSAAVDRLIAGTGNDTLIGNGGADVMRGGAGDDVHAVSDLTFADIDGGTGRDTLQLDGSGQTLDLTTLDNTSLSDIEVIDLNSSGNTLVIDQIELQRLTDSAAQNTLRVLGDTSDAVTLEDGLWTTGAHVTDAEGTFAVFTRGNATIEIQQGIGIATGPFELADVEAGIGGFVINGVTDGDRSGSSVSAAGDVNGDGFDDLIVGAIGVDTNGNDSGAGYVVFGKTDGSKVELSDVDDPVGTGGFVISGVTNLDRSGFSVSSAGDVNGDGLDDLIVGAYAADPSGGYSGASYVVFGKSDNSDAVELSELELDGDARGFVINGVTQIDRSGFSVSTAGDVNGDGFDDLIVGANGADPSGSDSGASYVVFGKTDGSAVELSDVDDPVGTGGFVINGVAIGDFSGNSVSTAGDVNGDGLDDLIVGAVFADPIGIASGASYVVFGKTDGTAVDLSAVQGGTDGFVIKGVASYDYSGRSVSSAGDVNGDGLDDLIVGADGDDPHGLRSGASFVVFGKSDNTTAVELSDIDGPVGTGGFVINGVAVGDSSGRSVSSAGDVNGDGLDDLIVGAFGVDTNGNDSGASYVVYGKTDGTAVELSDVDDGLGGFVINGVTDGDLSGVSVSSAGDVNGDGFDDLIVGASDVDTNGGSSGASFVVFGGDFSGAATEIGTTGADDLAGTLGNDNIFAGTGDDTVTSGGGADRVSGGNGADEFAFLDQTGTVTVTDFVSSEGDMLDVSAFLGMQDITDIQAAATPEGPGGHDTRIALDGNTFVVLIGVETTDLVSSDFTFAAPP